MSTLNVEFTDIAIIGMASRFPGAKTPCEFWDNLIAEKESGYTFNENELEKSGVKKDSYNKNEYVKRGVVLEDIEYFDADFFEFTPNDAKLTDPQQRIFLECAWEALEVSGYPSNANPRNIGVYGSMSPSTYLLRNICQSKEYGKDILSYPVMLGNDKDFLSTRVSYKLNLTGPSLSIQTACSSSLVAVHVACQSLINGECEMALAGGVSITVPQQTGYLYKEGGTLSKDGYCRSFDDEATGTVKGNGCGIILLKPLEKALEDRDTIHAVIKSTAINNDGRLKIGFTAPSPTGQANAIHEAIEMAGITPEDIEYIETHGTGTSLGDPIEIKALSDAFSTTKKQFCAIGSVKPNIGHLDAAAGIANVIKATMVLKENTIPKSIHYKTPNKKIDFQNSPFYVNESLQRRNKENPLVYAGVSSLGMGGTNAHAILQKAPERITETQVGPHILILSAKPENKLEQMIDQLQQHIKTHPNQTLSDIAYTLAVGRKVFDARTYMVCHDKEELLDECKSNQREQTNQVSETNLKTYTFSISATANRKYYVQLYNELNAYRLRVDDLIQQIETKSNINSLKKNLLESDHEDFRSSREDILLQFVCLHSIAKLLLDLGIHPTKINCSDQISDFVAASIVGIWSTDKVIDSLLNKLYGLADRQQVISTSKGIKVISSSGRDIQAVISNPDSHWIERCSVSDPKGFTEHLFKKEVTMFSIPIMNPESSPAFAFLDLMGKMWILGTEIDWSLLYDNQAVGRIPLPTYPFDKKKFWIDIDSNFEKETKTDNINIGSEQNDSLEKQITYIWEKSLDIEGILPDDDFFLNLDGDSLTAIDIIADIKSKLNIIVSMEEFMTHSTLKSLITHLQTLHQSQNLFKLNSEQIVLKIKDGTQPRNLFFIHPSGGTVMIYNQLAKYLNEHPTLYGIQFPVELLNSSNLSMEQLAERYISEIRKVQPKGPYLIGGYSFGGNLALEMALQLQQQGEQVSDLIMIDSFVPSTYNSQNIDNEKFVKSFPILVNALFRSKKSLGNKMIEQLQEQTLDEMIESLCKLNVIPKEFPVSDLKQFFEIWCINIQILQKYKPQSKFMGSILIFDAIERGSDLNDLTKYLGELDISKEEWKNYIDGNLNVISLSGDHYSIFNIPNNLQIICDEIEKNLSLVLV
ncbi:3-oxoacyl-(acyl-carrier-protein) synthase/thioesterase domain-containing protein/acyl carrier protein [Peribacillus simplex]|uniref:type I polyketide synthase n=1 Tax=Peribacillus simplex TaxID=1478 RepID=UPI0024E1F845|nr:beta-ketoacyl synthase N-terminal-like domain-containing protein [Peribacillus simplex]MDF9761649.1 3-oxoacyl-(acyl-carrier-protein) synthase/thioesterase domain-containing protein/acyl carrier protein [Peribacillus simplex]